MKLTDFKYNLPKNLIAKFPVEPRDSARLMVINRETGEIENRIFSEVIEFMNKGDVLVVNDTKVIQARLIGKKRKNISQNRSICFKRT